MKTVGLGLYKNIKTQKYYSVKGFVTNATNAQDGEQIVLYKDPISEKKYVREINEFKSKFTRNKS